ncbi:MAG: isoprenylcysteine carboxylmethyltransferase family protein [Terriglobia bacterium]
MTDFLNRVLDTMALIYAILFFPAPFFWVVMHSGIGYWRRFGNRAFVIALPIWGVIGTGLVVGRHELFSERMSRNALSWVMGLLVLGMAVWIDRQVMREFTVRRLAGLPEVNPGRYPGGVVRSGIYARVRHPRYIEYMLTLLGLALLTGAVGIFLLAIVTVLLYLIVAPLEERELREHYGPVYEAYARSVPRFVPRLWRKTKTQISA